MTSHSRSRSSPSASRAARGEDVVLDLHLDLSGSPAGSGTRPGAAGAPPLDATITSGRRRLAVDQRHRARLAGLPARGGQQQDLASRLPRRSRARRRSRGRRRDVLVAVKLLVVRHGVGSVRAAGSPARNGLRDRDGARAGARPDPRPAQRVPRQLAGLGDGRLRLLPAGVRPHRRRQGRSTRRRRKWRWRRR